MRLLSALLCGSLFGLGLVISGMANPAKVQNFLDITGTWDASLVFVMIGAIAVTLPGYRYLRGWNKPVLTRHALWPTATDIDARLIGGAAVFGVGWALAGYCPGPAITALPLMDTGTVVFVVPMLAGLFVARKI